MGDDLPVPFAHASEQGITPAMFAKMQKDYRQWAGEANANAWAGRTDWTAADMQAVNIARYKAFANKSEGYGAEGLMNKQYVAMNFELEPHPGTDFYEAFLHLKGLVNLTPDQLRDWNEGLSKVQGDVGRWWRQRRGRNLRCVRSAGVRG